MIIQEINNLIKNIETINEAATKATAKTVGGTAEGLKNIGKGALQAWKPLSLAAGGAYLYHKGKEDAPLINPTVAGLSALGGAAGMHYLYKKNRENNQFSS